MENISEQTPEGRGLCVAADLDPVAELTIQIMPHWVEGTEVERAGWAKIIAGQLVAHLGESLGELRFGLPADPVMTVATARLRLAAGTQPNHHAIYVAVSRLITALTAAAPAAPEPEGK